MSQPPRVSVAVPMYNEEAVLPEFLRRLGAVLDETPGGPHEIVIVDDGSRDRTLAQLEAAAAQDPRLVVVALSRNFGHQAALTAALDHVTGDVTVLMDGDLQDQPESIPTFLRSYADGYDVVYAQRASRKEGLWLRASYAIYYRLLSKLSNLQLPVDAGDFGLMSRRVVEQIRRTPERHRYLRGLRAWAGFRQIGIPVDRQERYAGRSKYSLAKLFRLAFDGIFAFSIAPLRAAAILGLIAIVLSTLFSIYSLVAKLFFHQSPKGFTALILVVTFLSGVNLFFLGVIGEYVGRIYEEAKSRPLYIVDRVIGRRSKN
ncbi:MAG TPA: glycosyltransferase family 2 protein [Gemmatimonadales bacterium]|nr:glycosyltransferase family 2 protein [Gemmatimonadales bacterium]